MFIIIESFILFDKCLSLQINLPLSTISQEKKKELKIIIFIIVDVVILRTSIHLS